MISLTALIYVATTAFFSFLFIGMVYSVVFTFKTVLDEFNHIGVDIHKKQE